MASQKTQRYKRWSGEEVVIILHICLRYSGVSSKSNAWLRLISGFGKGNQNSSFLFIVNHGQSIFISWMVKQTLKSQNKWLIARNWLSRESLHDLISLFLLFPGLGGCNIVRAYNSRIQSRRGFAAGDHVSWLRKTEKITKGMRFCGNRKKQVRKHPPLPKCKVGLTVIGHLWAHALWEDRGKKMNSYRF